MNLLLPIEIVPVRTSRCQTAYLSALALSVGVVGNSSSGLIEAPAYGVRDRKYRNLRSGRLKASSVIDCVPDRDEIKELLPRC